MKRTNNDATRFILPMLYHIDIEKNRLFRYNDEFFIVDNFINCFIGDTKNEPIYTIYLAYKIEKSYEFQHLEDNIVRHPLYLDDYTITYSDQYKNLNKSDNTSRVVVYKFKIPTEYYVDFHLIKNGWYSKITSRMKNQILDFWRLRGLNLVHSILYSTDLILDHLRSVNEYERLMENSNPGERWFKFDLQSAYMLKY